VPDRALAEHGDVARATADVDEAHAELLSSSVSTASEDASGCKIRSFTSSPQRRTHLTMFCAAETAPVTMCTLTSSRHAAHAERLSHPILPSMMNSWVRMCSTCWSVGMGMARAVSIARSTSTASPLVLDRHHPRGVEALDVAPGDASENALDLGSQPSILLFERALDGVHVASMFTTTPFFRPLDS